MSEPTVATLNSRRWRKASANPPLEEVFRSIRVPTGGGGFKRFLAFAGPGYLVAVGAFNCRSRSSHSSCLPPIARRGERWSRRGG